jgi:hypothetical protein
MPPPPRTHRLGQISVQRYLAHGYLAHGDMGTWGHGRLLFISLFISLVCLFPLRATSHSHTAAQIHTHTQIADPHLPHGTCGSGTWGSGTWPHGHLATWPPGTWGHGQICTSLYAAPHYTLHLAILCTSQCSAPHYPPQPHGHEARGRAAAQT